MVWLARLLHIEVLDFKMLASPVLNTSLQMPEFTITYTGCLNEKCSSEYLSSNGFVETLRAITTYVSSGAAKNYMSKKENGWC